MAWQFFLPLIPVQVLSCCAFPRKQKQMLKNSWHPLFWIAALLFEMRLTIYFILLFFGCFLLSPIAWAENTGADRVTLDTCISVVLEKSPELASARADIEEKEAIAKSVQKDLYPSFAFEYGYTQQPDATVQEDDYYGYTVSVEQPLYKGGALIAAAAMSKLDLKSSSAVFASSINDLIYRIHQAYYTVLKTGKLEEVAHQAVLRLQSHRKDAKAFYDVGLIPKNDLLQSEVKLAIGQQDLLKAQNRTLMSKSSLNVMMKRPVETPLSVEDVLTYEPHSFTWENVREQALLSRPEILQGKLFAEKAEKDIVSAKSGYFPTITLSASYTKQGDMPDVDSYLYGPNEVRLAKAVASWQFWSWGQTNDRVIAARRRLDKARESLSQLADTLILEARRAFLGLLEAEKNIGVARKAIEQAEENYRMNEARYKAQLATSTEVLDAQTLLSEAKTKYYNAFYDYRMAIAAVKRASGMFSLEQN